MLGRVFLVISTGHNVANVPPLLQFLDDNDTLVWIESEFAARKKWTHGASKVIQKRSQAKQKTVQFLDSMENALRPVAEQWLPSTEILVVGNGGTKLQLLVLWQAVTNLGFRPSMLYGEGSPCGWTLNKELTTFQKAQPYKAPSITLREVLACGGHAIKESGVDTCIWPAAHAPRTESKYGIDERYTEELHNQHHFWGKNKNKETEELSFREAFEILKNKDQATLNKMLRVALGAMRAAVSRRNNSGRVLLSEKECIQRNTNNNNSFVAIHSVFNRAIQDAGRLNSDEKPPTERIGDVFENIVAQRVYHWLESDELMQSIVSEVHSGIKIVGRDPAIVVAEFDVLFVLRNGVLFNLECKSFDASKKDQDARDANLKKAASYLANTVLVLPIYTNMSKAAWFDGVFNTYKNFEAIAFTLLGQPAEFTYEKDEPGENERIQVPSFEQALKQRFKRYLLE